MNRTGFVFGIILAGLTGCKRVDPPQEQQPAATITITSGGQVQTNQAQAQPQPAPANDDDNSDTTTECSNGSDEKCMADLMNDPGPKGEKERHRERDDLRLKLKMNLPQMVIQCINGTKYIVHDSYSWNVGLSPLFENGSSSPTKCSGGFQIREQGEVRSVDLNRTRR